MKGSGRMGSLARRLMLGAFVAATLGAMAVPADAQPHRGDDRRYDRGHDRRDDRRDWRRDRRPGPPPVYYRDRPVYAPPPVYYGAPRGPSLNLFLPFGG